jgi:hypothetical protein
VGSRRRKRTGDYHIKTAQRTKLRAGMASWICKIVTSSVNSKKREPYDSKLLHIKSWSYLMK